VSNKKTFLGVELSQKRWVNFLFFLLIPLFLLSMIMSFYIDSKYLSRYTPIHFVTDQNSILFGIDQKLYHLDMDGSLLSTYNYQDFNTHKIEQISLLQKNLLILESNGMLKKCNKQMCQELFYIDTKTKIIPKDNETMYLLSSGQLRSYNITTKQFKSIYLPYIIKDVFVYNDQLLLLDNNNTLAMIKADQPIWTEDVNRSKWIKHFTISSNNLWITTVRSIYYKPLFSSKAFQKIESQIIDYPMAIVPYRDGVLVLDKYHLKIFSIDSAKRVRIFGSQAFNTILDEIYTQRDSLQTLSIALFIISLVAVFILIMLAYFGSSDRVRAQYQQENQSLLSNDASNEITRKYQMKQQLFKTIIPQEKLIQADKDGIVWLYRKTTWDYFASNVILFIGLIFFFYNMLLPSFNIYQFLIFIYFITNSVIALLDQTIAIGIDKHFIYIQNKDKSIRKMNFENIFYTPSGFYLNVINENIVNGRFDTGRVSSKEIAKRSGKSDGLGVDTILNVVGCSVSCVELLLDEVLLPHPTTIKVKSVKKEK